MAGPSRISAGARRELSLRGPQIYKTSKPKKNLKRKGGGVEKVK